MSMDISITLSDADIEHFVAGIRATAKRAETLEDATIIADARERLAEQPGKNLPGFIKSRLDSITTMVEMVEDAGFELPAEERKNTLAALAYFADPQDAIADSVPVLGYLDDAIMIELCVRELTFELEAYEDFRDWRGAEAKRRGEDVAKLKLGRTDWTDARREEAIMRMRRRRKSSYAGSSWQPTLFHVR